MPTNSKAKKTDLGFKYYVKHSRLELLRAVREKYADKVHYYHEQNENAMSDKDKYEYYFSGTRFFVNKQVVEEDIIAPTPKDMMNLSNSCLAAMEQVQFAPSIKKEIQLSNLQAFATKVSTTDDIDLAYMRMRSLHKYADMILLGYRLKNGENIIQGCTSNRQHCGDQEVLKALKKYQAINTAVFLVWEYGGIPLGSTRFENIRTPTTQALQELQPETIALPNPPPQPQCAGRGGGSPNTRGHAHIKPPGGRGWGGDHHTVATRTTMEPTLPQKAMPISNVQDTE